LLPLSLMALLYSEAYGTSKKLLQFMTLNYFMKVSTKRSTKMRKTGSEAAGLATPAWRPQTSVNENGMLQCAGFADLQPATTK
jgi:hypothetical protein